jgi:predicted ArsR family transcriptional regulator
MLDFHQLCRWLRNCPFDALAREHAEIVCGMNLAIMTAVTVQLPRPPLLRGSNLRQTVAVLS